jgi:hypothetical protein
LIGHSKGIWRLNFHLYAAHRMCELKAIGVQVKSCAAPAIQFIAGNGRVEPPGMCSMHPQLVGTTRYREKMYTRLPLLVPAYTPVRARSLAVFITYHLPGSVIQINPEWQVNSSFAFFYDSIEQGCVSFLYTLGQELLL